MTNTLEQWRDIPGFEGAYQVSDQGSVRSLDRHVLSTDGRTILYKGRSLRPAPRPSGHLTVSFAGRSHTVHTLVLKAFIGPPVAGMEVRHLDGDEQKQLPPQSRIRDANPKFPR
jgi:hypothetical protein